MSKTLSYLIFLALIPSAAVAQITPDSSLGAENSVVESSGNRDTIQGGAVRDANLFHSFTEFNVGAGREAYFANPDSIANIFSRVTGNNISDIQGVLGVLGNANLYLINPNGILFGENARLDVNGSFLATTADSVVFGNGLEFNAVNPNQPPLLTIDIPIGLRFRDNPGDIVNQSTANNDNGLEVSVGENITLVGGDLDLAGGNIWAPGGRVELGGLSTAGEIGISANGGLSFPNEIERADVTLTNAAEVDVRAGSGGNITVNARNLELSGGELGASSLRAGIAPESSSTTAQAGDITLNVTDTITVSQESLISNRVEESGFGNSGRIDITTTDLTLTQGGQVTASTFGQGDAGTVTINASGTISADGEGSGGFGSGIRSTVEDTAVGNSGEMNITTTDLSLTQGGGVFAGTFGQGDAGTVTINASGTISADGENSSFGSGIGNIVAESGVGNSGGINITTTDLSLTRGGTVAAGTLGQGDAGAVTINASGTISADGERSASFGSGISSLVADTAVGNSGRIDITTTDLSLTKGGEVVASTFGQGDAGAVTINASGTISADGEGSAGFASGIFSAVAADTAVGNSGGIDITTTDLTLTQGGQVNASTVGQGDAGAVTINASGTLSADGERSAGFASGIFSTVEELGVGNSGGIDITTTDLSLTQGGQVNASTLSGEGDAGAVIINASGTISADGERSAGFASGIFSQVEELGVGNSGGIKITTTDLTLTQGGVVTASTGGEGNAGAITIEASGTISADGEGSAGFLFPSGIGSIIPGLSVTQEGVVTTSTFGQGDTGAVPIDASGTISADGEGSGGLASGIFSLVAESGVGNSGGINITTTDLSLTQGGLVAASTFGEGDAGAITIEASGTISADGEGSGGFPFPSSIGSIVAESGVGNSGEINITTTDLSLTQGGQVVASNFGEGDAGTVTINASGTISADGESSAGFPLPSNIGSIVGESGVGNSGGINITTTDLSLTQGGQVNASTLGEGDAGTVTIDASGTISADGENSAGLASGIFSQVEELGVGNSGGIKITTTDLTLTQGGVVTASTGGEGNAGAVTIDASGTISADGQGSAGFLFPGGIGSIIPDVSVTQRGVIVASTGGEGDAGAVTIDASGTISADGQGSAGLASGIFSTVAESGVGNSGGIEITTTDLTLTQGGQVIASTFGQGDAGTVTINTNNLFLTNDALISVQSGAQGNAGDLSIQANSLALEKGASLAASTPVGTGGNITLQIAERLTLREESNISAQATNNANGGNVTIDSEFIIAFPNQNNDIIASASQGRGGNINLTAEGVLGLEARSSTPTNETNDIDASSELGLSGEVSIEQLDVDPASGLVELTQEVVDASQLITQNVCQQTANSSFVDIGKGGLPQNPDYVLAEDGIEVGLVAPVVASGEEIETNREIEEVKPRKTRKPPAQGWIWQENGIVELVAYNPHQVGEQRTWNDRRGCQ